MSRMVRRMGGLAALAASSLLATAAAGADPAAPFAKEAIPTGLTVQLTDLDGYVYADAQGHTLYTWLADPPGKSACTNARYTEAKDYFTNQVYKLPEALTRPSCRETWLPLVAPADAKPVGAWNIIENLDGLRQWTYQGRALYRWVLDEGPGQVNGVGGGVGVSMRTPLAVPTSLPPGVSTTENAGGRAFTIHSGQALLYVQTTAQACGAECRTAWRPFTAPALANPPSPDWTVVEKNGLRQWAFKGQALYSPMPGVEEGPAGQGWSMALLTQLPKPPPGVTRNATPAGEAYADSKGRTLYVFYCREETSDGQLCEVTSPTYRLSLCGGPEKCRKTWRTLPASSRSTSGNRTWTAVRIDARTGARVWGDAGARKVEWVWAYRGRPVYTYAGDPAPGDANGANVRIFILSSFDVLLLNGVRPLG